MARRPRPRASRTVAVLTTRQTPWADRMLAGIREFSERGPKWEFFIVRHDRVVFANCLEGFDGLGAIVCGESTVLGTQLDAADARVPVVWAGCRPRADRCAVAPDYRAVGAKAVAYLIQRGFRHVGYFDARDLWYNDEIAAGFIDACRDAGLVADRFVHGPRMKPGDGWRLDDQLNDLSDWLRYRDRPLGLLAADDTHAQRAIQAAARAGLKAPEDTAILGVGNDEDFCQFTTPSLSSIDLRPERLGFEAAAVLAERLAGRPSPAGGRRVAPGELVHRQSSDVLGARDACVVQAVQFVRDHIEEPVRVEDLVEHTGVSRSNLQRRFHRALGYCPGEAIRRTRIDAVRRLLIETRLPLADIAVRCGFGHVSQLSRDFKRATGLSPTAFRADLP